MTANRILVDAGPLVALLNENDAGHAVCAAAAQNLPLPLVTTWLVLAEAAWLLRRTNEGTLRLLRLLEGRVVECPELDDQAPTWMASCLQRYADLEPQLADVSLLYLADRETIACIFTLDRRDFSVYRNAQNQPFELVP
ncbi:MAG: PIN domain-containing protein [Pirellulales bacterium]